MHPASLYQALAFLKQNNALYKKVDIVMENVPYELLDFSDNEDAQELDNCTDSIEEVDNSLHSCSLDSQKTMFIPHIVTLEEVSIAPGEGKAQVSIFNDSFSKELAFQCLFPTYKKILL